MKDKVKITEDDLKAAFEQGQGQARHARERGSVQQISFPDKAAADAAYQKIQSGTDFVALAKELGPERSRYRPRHVEARRRWPTPTIGDAAFKLEKDKVSEPVTGQLGKTVLLRVTAIEPGKVVTFEEAKPELEKKVLKERAQGAIFDLHDSIEDERASGTQLSEVAEKFKLNYQVFDQVDRRGQAPDGKVVDLPQKTDLLNAVFATEVGVENDPLDAKDEGLIWYEVLGHHAEAAQAARPGEGRGEEGLEPRRAAHAACQIYRRAGQAAELGQDPRRPRQGAEHAGPGDASR